MNKLDYNEYKNSSSPKEWKQKASDKLKADNKAVFDALQQIDTDLNNLAEKYGDEFRKVTQEFYENLQVQDIRGINKVKLLPSSDSYISTSNEADKKSLRAENFSVDRLGLYSSDIRFKVTSESGGWSCPITISKTLTRPATHEWAREGDEERIPANERKFDKLDTPVTFDAFNTTAKEDADAFVKGESYVISQLGASNGNTAAGDALALANATSASGTVRKGEWPLDSITTGSQGSAATISFCSSKPIALSDVQWI